MVHIDTIHDEALTTVTINGDVDASSSIQLDESLSEAMENTKGQIIVDGTNLNYISSAGLGVFMSYIEDLNNRNIKFILFGLNEKVMNVFEILGLDQLLSIENTKDEALNKLNEA